MKTATIKLAEKNYTIKELPSRKNAEWKQLFIAKLAPAGALAEMVKGAKLPTSVDEFNTLGGDALMDVLKTAGGIVFNSFDDMRDLVIAYSPELEKNKAHLLDNAYDSEYMEAIIEVVKIAFPFGAVMKVMEVLKGLNGLSEKQSSLLS